MGRGDDVMNDIHPQNLRAGEKISPRRQICKDSVEMLEKTY